MEQQEAQVKARCEWIESMSSYVIDSLAGSGASASDLVRKEDGRWRSSEVVVAMV